MDIGLQGMFLNGLKSICRDIDAPKQIMHHFGSCAPRP
jgi:hypothetical protein